MFIKHFLKPLLIKQKKNGHEKGITMPSPIFDTNYGSDYQSRFDPDNTITAIFRFLPQDEPVQIEAGSDHFYALKQMASSSNVYLNETCIKEADILSLFQSSNENNCLPQPKEQIEALRRSMGFNISEIAAILLVQRPTIYEWLESESPKLRKSNQQRLDEIYKICVRWQQANLGRIGGYLRRVVYKNKSLFSLLSERKLNYDFIYETLNIIEEIMKKNALEQKKHQDFLEKYGLEEESKKRRRWKTSIHRSIGYA